MTKIYKKDPIPMGIVTEADIKKAAQEQEIVIGAGDIVLLHSGVLKATESDTTLPPGKPLGGQRCHISQNQCRSRRS